MESAVIQVIEYVQCEKNNGSRAWKVTDWNILIQRVIENPSATTVLYKCVTDCITWNGAFALAGRHTIVCKGCPSVELQVHLCISFDHAITDELTGRIDNLQRQSSRQPFWLFHNMTRICPYSLPPKAPPMLSRGRRPLRQLTAIFA